MLSGKKTVNGPKLQVIPVNMAILMTGESKKSSDFVDCSCCIVGFRCNSFVADTVAAADFSAEAFDQQFAVAVVAAVLAPFSVHLVAKTAFAKTAEKRNRLVVAGLACPRRWWRLPPLAALAPRHLLELEIHLALDQNRTTTRPLRNR